LTLPTDSVVRAERIARARKVNLSTVIAEDLSDGLRAHNAAERSEEVLSAYKRALNGFSAGEMAVLDGILLEPRQAPLLSRGQWDLRVFHY
jgi:citrate lyase beta subunit